MREFLLCSSKDIVNYHYGFSLNKPLRFLSQLYALVSGLSVNKWLIVTYLVFFLCGVSLFTSGILLNNVNNTGFSAIKHKLTVCADPVVSQGKPVINAHESPCSKQEFNRIDNIA